MLFKNVVIQSLAAVEPPIRVKSQEIMNRLTPTMERLGLRPNLIEELTGILERKVWKAGTMSLMSSLIP